MGVPLSEVSFRGEAEKSAPRVLEEEMKCLRLTPIISRSRFLTHSLRSRIRNDTSLRGVPLSEVTRR